LKRQISTKRYKGLLLAPQYDDLVTLLRFANLALEYTDEVVLQPPIGQFAREDLVPTRIRTGRKLWQWPQPLDKPERARTLAAFAARLRRGFSPERKHAVATLHLRAGTYDIPSVEKAFELAGSVISVLTKLALRNHVGQPPGIVSVVQRSDLPIQMHVGADHIIEIIEPAPDVLERYLLPALKGCDARRIRECPSCLRLFIAKRHDQIACERRCANLLRVRRFRSPEVKLKLIAGKERENRGKRR
jgi:hypothetical protein